MADFVRIASKKDLPAGTRAASTPNPVHPIDRPPTGPIATFQVEVEGNHINVGTSQSLLANLSEGTTDATLIIC